MSSMSPSLDQLVDALKRLPGLGPRSASRIAEYLLADDRTQAAKLLSALERALKTVKHCELCNTLSDEAVCPICADESRDRTKLCVVESPADQRVIEETMAYRGLYFVLMGLGFSDVTKAINIRTGSGLKKGDILLNHIHHVAVYIGDGKIAQASINEKGKATGGQPGDQTGREFLVRPYRNYPWNCVLRYGGGDGTASSRPGPVYEYSVKLGFHIGAGCFIGFLITPYYGMKSYFSDLDTLRYQGEIIW